MWVWKPRREKACANPHPNTHTSSNGPRFTLPEVPNLVDSSGVREREIKRKESPEVRTKKEIKKFEIKLKKKEKEKTMGKESRRHDPI
ncbi:hypothetical protein IE53DRAFT_391334 [Violaceomyces palustris]|uniref:Uncharacterized protein n=1 Tax=Violaceomyces palustris TaxID=1673888 RepID=A0ACD0NKW1_9BASI|nr:hypothetical protein IE53DRAFT_391334 [Violaceomyces palustris]